jgi:hypothetical protein
LSQKIPNYFCDFCNKTYKERSGLWKHKKTCCLNNKHEKNEEKDKKETNLVMMLIEENHDLKNMMMEVIKNGTNNTINNNSHNKSFNLNLFLNETCKDAMNITDFVNSINLQLSDLEKVGEVGYIDGITNIIVKNLKGLDITQRPIHCTDSKREVLYVKDENKWEKENETKTKIRKAIKHIAHKNSKLIPAFRELHPDCGKSISKYSDQFNKIVIEAMGGHGDNDVEKEDKIIKNISKNIILNKENDL